MNFCKNRFYDPGSMIMSQAKRSPINFFYKDFYQNMISKIGMKIMRSNEERMKNLNKEINSFKDEENSVSLEEHSSKHIETDHFIERYNTHQSRRDSIDKKSSKRILREVTVESFEILSKMMITEENRKDSSKCIKPIPTQDCDEDLRDQDSDGIYIIEKGKCAIVNPYDKYLAKVLYKNDIFGENDILRINGYQAYGDILSLNSVECIFLSKECLNRIPFYELYNIKQFLATRIELKKLNYISSQRYKIEIDPIRNY